MTNDDQPTGASREFFTTRSGGSTHRGAILVDRRRSGARGLRRDCRREFRIRTERQRAHRAIEGSRHPSGRDRDEASATSAAAAVTPRVTRAADRTEFTVFATRRSSRRSPRCRPRARSYAASPIRRDRARWSWRRPSRSRRRRTLPTWFQVCWRFSASSSARRSSLERALLERRGEGRHRARRRP